MPPNAVSNTEFYLQNYTRGFLLRSIYFDFQINQAGLENLPLEQNNVIINYLYCRAFPLGHQAGEPMLNLNMAPTATLQDNGYSVRMYHPRQLTFESWDISEQLYFQIHTQNLDLANTWQVWYNIIVEVIDVIHYDESTQE